MPIPRVAIATRLKIGRFLAVRTARASSRPISRSGSNNVGPGRCGITSCPDRHGATVRFEGERCQGHEELVDASADALQILTEPRQRLAVGDGELVEGGEAVSRSPGNREEPAAAG